MLFVVLPGFWLLDLNVKINGKVSIGNCTTAKTFTSRDSEQEKELGKLYESVAEVNQTRVQ